MADITKLLRYVDGFHKEVDLNGGSDILKVSSIKIGSNNAEITGTIADKLILIASVTDGSSGADQVGLTAVRTQVTVQSGIEKLDTDLGTAEGKIDDLVTLSGVAANAESLGTFTGTTIADSSTIKAALQSLETALEEIDVNANDLITLSGVAENAQHLGTFTGSTIADSSTIKSALQAIETAHETTAGVASGAADDVGHLVTLSGVAVDSDHLGTFTGSTIADSQTIKAALQALETALEEIDTNANDLITLSGVAENAQNLGSFTGSVIADNQTIKAAIQALETYAEASRSMIENFEWYPSSALDYVVDNTAAPATENLNDVYVLSHNGGTPHANYDGAAAGDIVKFNGTSWVKTTPTTGMFIAVDDESSSLRMWGGASWGQKYFESTTASTGCTKSGFDIRLADASASNGISVSSGAISMVIGSSWFEFVSNALSLKANSIGETELNNVDGAVDADSFVLPTGYVAASGTVAAGDTIKQAIAKLDARSSVQSLSITLTNNSGSQINAGAVVALSQTVAGEIILADADALSTCECIAGVVVANIANEASGLVQIAGEVTPLKDGNFDVGKRVYLSATAGNATKTAPANKNIVLLGGATATDKLILNPHLELAI